MDRLEVKDRVRFVLASHEHAPIGSHLLMAILVLLYWLPIVLWFAKALVSRAFAPPPGLPFWQLTGRTLWLSSVSATLAILAAYPYALLWRISEAPLRLLLNSIMILPMVMGLLARNYSWIGLLGLADRNPSLSFLPNIIYTQTAVYVVMACIFVPIAFFILVQGTTSISNEHMDAGRTLGASERTLLIRMLLPQTYRAALLSLGIITAMAVGYFITPRMMGGGKVDFISNSIIVYLGKGYFDGASRIAFLFLLVVSPVVILIMIFSMKRRLLTSGR